jgi:hypothetical protein
VRARVHACVCVCVYACVCVRVYVSEKASACVVWCEYVCTPVVVDVAWAVGDPEIESAIARMRFQCLNKRSWVQFGLGDRGTRIDSSKLQRNQAAHDGEQHVLHAKHRKHEGLSATRQ